MSEARSIHFLPTLRLEQLLFDGSLDSQISVDGSFVGTYTDLSHVGYIDSDVTINGEFSGKYIALHKGDIDGDVAIEAEFEGIYKPFVFSVELFVVPTFGKVPPPLSVKVNATITVGVE